MGSDCEIGEEAGEFAAVDVSLFDLKTFSSQGLSWVTLEKSGRRSFEPFKIWLRGTF